MTGKRLQVLMLIPVDMILKIHRLLIRLRKSPLRAAPNQLSIKIIAKRMEILSVVEAQQVKKKRRRKKLCLVPTTMKLLMEEISKKIMVLQSNAKMKVHQLNPLETKYHLEKMRII